ncbi:ergothioneine biosynthesis protein EgtB [Sphingosinicellaceae bacterium]|nr:ergothioneine biosynthesis protein EgtB [Sphingosinicellaceae bacterium]
MSLSAAKANLSSDLLQSQFEDVRALTVALAAPLSDADATAQSMPDASPAKWHLAHTTWFLETFVVVPNIAGYRRFDERFDFLFNSYYESVGPRHARDKRGLITRPALDEILAWRAHVDAALDGAWSRFDDDTRALIELGINHEQQHQELLVTDLLHLFAQNPIEPAAYTGTPRPAAETSGRWSRHPGGIVRVGHDVDSFAFDCEGPAYDTLLRPFELAADLVTNAEWDAFVADGGYRTAALWLADGWAWVKREGIDAPLYWSDGTAMTLTGRRERDPNAPVTHVSFYEADAFATWAGARLPLETEWEFAAAAADPRVGNQLDGPGAIAPVGGSGLFGDVWQWTGSAFLPYPGFRPAPGAVGEYNGKFMSGQMVLKGASCATPRGSSRASTRNFFYPHQRWQFTGVRLAKDH